MKCPYCNAYVRAGVRYCSHCGKLIGASVASSKGSPTQTNSHAASSDSNGRSLSPGAHLQGGRYVIQKVIGQGGMGTALLATDIRLDGKAVVIKELFSDSTDPTKRLEDVRNFKREVSTLAHIDHPLVPNVTDHFQEGTRYFMVQEYVDGEDLEQRLERTNVPMEEREALICAFEILDVLDYLAQLIPPIVHRDIKPANIIIGARDKRAHLVDFGIARADEVKNAQRKQTSALGTPGYCPPEQYQGNADPRSDLYALAATLHHVLTNRDPRHHPPFHYPPVRSINAQLSPEIERVLIQALNNDVNQRYQSAAAFKQDIDAILRQRFGISGNIDSYTLGTTGPTIRVTGMAQANAGSTSAQTVVGQVPLTPVHPLSALVPPTPLRGRRAQPSSRSSRNASSSQRRRNLAGCLISLLVLCGLIVGGVWGALSLVHTSANTNGVGATQIGNEAIGVSDGTVAFDTTLPDGVLKNQATQALKQNSNNLNTALSLLAQALSITSNDAEALIYQENLQVVSSGRPYVTVGVATMLTGDRALTAVGRDDLQGAYVGQKEFNDASRLHGGVMVRLLVANSGSKTAYVPQVTQRLVNIAQSDKTFIGVMGWPFSSRTLAAIQGFGAAHIPLVSQTASDDSLTNASSYFFRVVPANRVQGAKGALFARNVLHARQVALFADAHDPYSRSLAADFKQQFVSDGGKVLVEEPYTVRDTATIPGAVQDALAHNPDLIYFAGYAADVSTLLSNLPGGDLPVLGGDALYELGGYQSSARVNFNRLRFTAFAYPDEWEAFGYKARKPVFFSEYSNALDPNHLHRDGDYGFTRPDNDVILSYDAMVALLSGCNNALIKAGNSSITPQDLQQGLKSLDRAHAIQGVSGQIAFGSDNDPLDKTIVMLTVDPVGHIQIEPTPLGRFLK